MSRVGGASSALTNNSNIPVDIQRAIRALEQRVRLLESQVGSVNGQLSNKLGSSPDDIKTASKQIRDELQANGSSPLSIAKLPGVAAQPQPSVVTPNTPITKIQQQDGTLVQQNGQLYVVKGGQLVPAMTSGNLTESGSGVLTVTGGTGAVLGSGTAVQVKQSSGSQDGYLSSVDWNTFNNKQSALTYTPLDRALNLSDLVSASTARANLGLGSAATQATSAFDAAGAATAAVAGIPNASGTVTGLLTSANWTTFNNKQAALGFTPLNPANNLSDVAAVATARTNLGLGTAAVQNMASFGAVTLAGTVNMNGQAFSGSTLGTFNIGRASNFASAAVIWAINVLNSAGSDNVSLGNSSATYSTGTIQWIGNSNAFLYFNSSQDFRIGAGIGATPAITVKGSNRVLIGTATDNGTDAFQVTGTAIVTGASFVLTNNFAAGATGYLKIESAPSSPRAGRLSFGTDGSGWGFVIAKNQGGTLTDILTAKDDLSVTVAGALKTNSLTTSIRTVTAADTATTTDHTIIANITLATTETLPAAPLNGQQIYLLNIGSAAWTIAGNGKSIWAAGSSGASISLAANATAILQYDGILWRRLV